MVFGRDTAPHVNIALGSHKIKEPAMEEHPGVCLATEPEGEMAYINCIKSKIKGSQTSSMLCKA